MNLWIKIFFKNNHQKIDTIKIENEFDKNKVMC